MSFLRRCCVACGRDGPALCDGCTRRLAPAPSTRIRGVGRVDALFAYSDVGADVIRGLKFHNARSVIATVSDAFAALVTQSAAPDIVTWLPTSSRRRRDRGFDQAELLARAVARRIGVRTVPVLRRRHGPPQTGRSWEERADNVVFEAAPVARRMTGRLAVFDDVCTTGATMRAASEALPAHLRSEVVWFALARTP